jgi:hypothetical protein
MVACVFNCQAVTLVAAVDMATVATHALRVSDFFPCQNYRKTFKHENLIFGLNYQRIFAHRTRAQTAVHVCRTVTRSGACVDRASTVTCVSSAMHAVRIQLVTTSIYELVLEEVCLYILFF